ncbi:NifU family protein [Vicingaceae bacterium]|nr:NifU family protein [Vicingaceae bacterium]
MELIKDKNELINTVEQAIEQLRPFLIADGGNIELIDITEDNIVQVKFIGACQSCSMSAMTLKGGVEETIRKAAPQIVSVIEVKE